MHQTGYSLILTATGAEQQSWVAAVDGHIADIPTVFALTNNNRIYCPSLNVDYGGVKLVERHRVDPPNRFYQAGASTLSFDGTKTIEDPHWIALTVAAAKALVKEEIDTVRRGMLAPTDRYVLQDYENAGRKMAASLKLARKAVRDQADTLSAEVDALTTLPDLAAWVQHDWPPTPAP